MDRTKAYSWTVVLITATILVALVTADDLDPPSIGIFLFWIGLLAAVDLLPVTLGYGTEVTMGFPIHLALAIIFYDEPWVAMTIAGIASFDQRELRREIPLHRALFNRSQTILAVGAAMVPF